MCMVMVNVRKAIASSEKILWGVITDEVYRHRKLGKKRTLQLL